MWSGTQIFISTFEQFSFNAQQCSKCEYWCSGLVNEFMTKSIDIINPSLQWGCFLCALLPPMHACVLRVCVCMCVQRANIWLKTTTLQCPCSCSRPWIPNQLIYGSSIDWKWYRKKDKMLLITWTHSIIIKGVDFLSL